MISHNIYIQYKAFFQKIKLIRFLQSFFKDINWFYLLANIFLICSLAKAGGFIYGYILIWFLFPFSQYYFYFDPLTFETYISVLTLILAVHSFNLFRSFPKKFELYLYIYHSLKIENLQSLANLYMGGVKTNILEMLVLTLIIIYCVLDPKNSLYFLWFITICIEIYCYYNIRKPQSLLWIPKWVKSVDNIGIYLYNYCTNLSLLKSFEENMSQVKFPNRDFLTKLSRAALPESKFDMDSTNMAQADSEGSFSEVTSQDFMESFEEFNLNYLNDNYISQEEFDDILYEYTFNSLTVDEYNEYFETNNSINWFWINFFYKILPIICITNIIIFLLFQTFGIPYEWKNDYEYMNSWTAETYDYFERELTNSKRHMWNSTWKWVNAGLFIHTSHGLLRPYFPLISSSILHEYYSYNYNILDQKTKIKFAEIKKYVKYMFFIAAKKSRRLKYYNFLWPGYNYYMQLKNFMEGSRLYPQNLRHTFFHKYLLYEDFVFYKLLTESIFKKRFFPLWKKRKKFFLWLYKRSKNWQKNYFFAAPAVNVFPDSFYKWLDLIRFFFVLNELQIDLSFSFFIDYFFKNDYIPNSKEYGSKKLLDFFFFYRNKPELFELDVLEKKYIKRRFLIRTLEKNARKDNLLNSLATLYFVSPFYSDEAYEAWLAQVYFLLKKDVAQPFMVQPQLSTVQKGGKRKNRLNSIKFNFFKEELATMLKIPVREIEKHLLEYENGINQNGFLVSINAFINSEFSNLEKNVLDINYEFFLQKFRENEFLIPSRYYRPQYNHLLEEYAALFGKAETFPLWFPLYEEASEDIIIPSTQEAVQDIFFISSFFNKIGNTKTLLNPLWWDGDEGYEDYEAFVEGEKNNAMDKDKDTDNNDDDDEIYSNNDMSIDDDDDDDEITEEDLKKDFLFFKNLLTFNVNSQIGYQNPRQISYDHEQWFDILHSFLDDEVSYQMPLKIMSENIGAIVTEPTPVEYEQQRPEIFSSQIDDPQILRSYFHYANQSVIPELIDSRLGNHLKNYQLLTYLKRDDPLNNLTISKNERKSQILQLFAYASNWSENDFYDIADIKNPLRTDEEFTGPVLQKAYNEFLDFTRLVTTVDGEIQLFPDKVKISRDIGLGAGEFMKQTDSLTSREQEIKKLKTIMWYKYYYQLDVLLNYYDFFPSYRKFFMETWPKDYLPSDYPFDKKLRILYDTHDITITPLYKDGWLLYYPTNYQQNYDISKIQTFYEYFLEDFTEPFYLYLF